MKILGSLFRWLILIVGAIEILFGLGDLFSAEKTQAGRELVLVLWLVAFTLAAYYEFNPKKVAARKAKATDATKEVE